MKREFEAGDRVRIRQWEDMVEEFGLDEGGQIKVGPKDVRFPPEMKHLCGRAATITDPTARFSGLNLDDKTGKIHWHYTTNMLEPLEEKTPIEKQIEYYERLLAGKNLNLLECHICEGYRHPNGGCCSCLWVTIQQAVETDKGTPCNSWADTYTPFEHFDEIKSEAHAGNPAARAIIHERLSILYRWLEQEKQKQKSVDVTVHSDLKGRPDDGLDREEKYPCLKINKHTGTVMLFSTPDRAVVVHEARDPAHLVLGSRYDLPKSARGKYEPLRGQIILENKEVDS